MPSPTLFAFGDNCLDVYLEVGGYTVGGNALNVAVGWQRLNGQVHYRGVIGTDQEAGLLLSGLTHSSLSTEGLAVKPGSTGVTFLASRDGDRTLLFEDFGVGSQLELLDQDIALARVADRTHIAGLPPQSGVVPQLVASGAVVSVDLSTNHSTAELHGVTTVFASHDDPDPATAISLATELLDAGCKEAVVTRGEHGAIVLSGCEPPVTIPAAPTVVTDTCGAGDAFIATYSHQRACGFSSAQAGAAASNAAAQTCRHLGGWPQPIHPVTDSLRERAAAAGVPLTQLP